MRTINHNQLKDILKITYNKNVPVFLWGGTGIGKSMGVYVWGKEQAQTEKRKFVVWNCLTENEKEQFINNSKNINESWILYDNRASECDTTDTKGIVNFTSDKKYLVWVNDIIWKMFENKEARGCIFLDEFNVAPSSIQASFYKIINDRKVGNTYLNEHIYRIGAGNRETDYCNVFSMAMALNNRFLHFELGVPSIESWTNWALNQNIDSRIVAFLNFKPSSLYMFDVKNKDKSFPTPRMWDKASKLIDSITDINMIEMLISSAVGEAQAIEFSAFMKLNEKIDVREILENPKLIKTYEDISLKYAIITGIAEIYKNTEAKKDKLMVLNQVLGLNGHIEAELLILLMRMTKGQNTEFFNNEVTKLKNWAGFLKDNQKYLLD